MENNNNCNFIKIKKLIILKKGAETQLSVLMVGSMTQLCTANSSLGKF